jgi:hypothetical protein
MLEQCTLGCWLLLSMLYRCVGMVFGWVDELVRRRLEHLLFAEGEGAGSVVAELPSPGPSFGDPSVLCQST